MDELQRRIIDVLHTGADEATSTRELAALLKEHPRIITKAVEHAIKDGAPICSSTDGKSGGYYLAESQEDAERYAARLDHRAAEIAERAAAIRRTAPTLPTG